MSFNRPNAVPRVPTLPAGDEVAAYDTYLEAQQAVDYLSDHKFAVEHVTIVGTDLRMVERVTGRLSYGRVALAGALSGAWFGFFVGLLLSLFGGAAAGGVLLVGIGLGAGFGLLFSVLSYALTGGRRDFTSSSQIVASTYAILCAAEQAGDARSMLLQSPGGLGKARRGAATAAPTSPVGAPAVGGPAAPAAPAAPRTPDPRWTTPSGAPRYGAMRPTQEQAPSTEPAPAPQPQNPEPQTPEPQTPEPQGPQPGTHQPEPRQPQEGDPEQPKAPEHDDPYRPPQP
ncbi:general stress protein [Isoptericola sp. F-RaC21]|uniref:general stress protein n=1 Tax=Isoptericola sp. F-RaC21 TaxID=3141452 RepID=UPI00315C1A77